jgi:hypothetical protein
MRRADGITTNNPPRSLSGAEAGPCAMHRLRLPSPNPILRASCRVFHEREGDICHCGSGHTAYIAQDAGGCGEPAATAWKYALLGHRPSAGQAWLRRGCAVRAMHHSQKHYMVQYTQRDKLQTTPKMSQENNSARATAHSMPREDQDGRLTAARHSTTSSFSFFSGRKFSEADLKSVPGTAPDHFNLTRNRTVPPLRPFTTVLTPFLFDSAPPSWPSLRTADKEQSD